MKKSIFKFILGSIIFSFLNSGCNNIPNTHNHSGDNLEMPVAEEEHHDDEVALNPRANKESGPRDRII